MTPGRWAALALLAPAVLLLRPDTLKHKPLSARADLILLLSFAVWLRKGWAVRLLGRDVR